MVYANRFCGICGFEFTPDNPRSKYCKREIIRICSICGRSYTTECSPDGRKCCDSEECKRKIGRLTSAGQQRICKGCGQKFIAVSPRQQFCNQRIKRTCTICGAEFEAICTPNIPSTCGDDECRNAYAHQQSVAAQQKTVRKCVWCGEKFHPVNNTQKYCDKIHYRNCVICGVRFVVDTSKQEKPMTCSKECAAKYRFRNGNPFQSSEARNKAVQTCIARYGVPHPMQVPAIREKLFAKYEAATGYSHPAKNPATWRRHHNVSSLEQYIIRALDNNLIEYNHEYMVTKGTLSHSFDFYLPKYNILIDADGIYYHGYMDDSNGVHIDEDRDQIRVALIPDNWYYFVVVESDKQSGIQEILNIIKSIDSEAFDYEQYMLDWCRQTEFPYPIYTEARMRKDYSKLCSHDVATYNPHTKYSLSTIRAFHKSIYHSHVGDHVSLYEAWYDEQLLRRAIKNRMLYVDNVDPSKVLSGLYISKIVPKVSVFNPVLAKYLVSKYLSDTEFIVDPFSGFSGRMLGTCAAGKLYIGHDKNINAVQESNAIIEFHGLSAEVTEQDIFDSDVQLYQTAGLLTCPPYGAKETYAKETIYQSCDDWIDLCLQKYKCRRYVFVVDKTERYSNNVVEILSTNSYLNVVNECVIVINT